MSTILNEVLAGHVETFIATRKALGRGLPQFVVKELRGFLRCGILQYGFVRTRCPTCGFERVARYRRSSGRHRPL